MSINLTPKVERTPFVNVNEIFGPTIQGEGCHTGHRVGFLRLAGCNLACVWCDTPYSWDWTRYDKDEESHKMTFEDIGEAIKPMKVHRLIVTGGEPMLQQRNFPAIAAVTGCLLDIETNGTIAPKDEIIDSVDMFVVSIKLAHAGDSLEARIKWDAIHKFSELAEQGKAIFKFVAQNLEDFDEVQQIVETGRIPAHSIWIMPEGMTADKQLQSMREVADWVIEKGWNLSPRLHTLIWNLERGH
jgi:organic radical activating enzyme